MNKYNKWILIIPCFHCPFAIAKAIDGNDCYGQKNNGFDMFEIMDPKDTFFNRLSLNTHTCVSKVAKGIGDPKDTFFNKLSLNTHTCVSKDDKGIGDMRVKVFCVSEVI